MNLNQLQKQLSGFLSNLNFPCTLTKREMILGAIACFSTGMVMGMLASPNKTVAMGSYNGSNNVGVPEAKTEEKENA